MNSSDIAKALGSRGGQKTLENKGKDHFRRISKLGAKARKRNRNKRKLSPKGPLDRLSSG